MGVKGLVFKARHAKQFYAVRHFAPDVGGPVGIAAKGYLFSPQARKSLSSHSSGMVLPCLGEYTRKGCIPAPCPAAPSP
jgi:hypothetical protein